MALALQSAATTLGVFPGFQNLDYLITPAPVDGQVEWSASAGDTLTVTNATVGQTVYIAPYPPQFYDIPMQNNGTTGATLLTTSTSGPVYFSTVVYIVQSVSNPGTNASSVSGQQLGAPSTALTLVAKAVEANIGIASGNVLITGIYWGSPSYADPSTAYQVTATFSLAPTVAAAGAINDLWNAYGPPYADPATAEADSVVLTGTIQFTLTVAVPFNLKGDVIVLSVATYLDSGTFTTYTAVYTHMDSPAVTSNLAIQNYLYVVQPTDSSPVTLTVTGTGTGMTGGALLVGVAFSAQQFSEEPTVASLQVEYIGT
jgi:hypothetical protein